MELEEERLEDILCLSPGGISISTINWCRPPPYHFTGLHSVDVRYIVMAHPSLLILLLLSLLARLSLQGCRLLGQPALPLLAAEGDVNIGAVFSIHRKPVMKTHTFTSEPEPISCIRFVLSALLYCIFHFENESITSKLQWKRLRMLTVLNHNVMCIVHIFNLYFLQTESAWV